MKKSGLASSPFFMPQTPKELDGRSAILPSSPKLADTTIPSDHDAETPQHHGIVIPQYQDTIIEHIRKAVKEFGKEAATYRFTAAEKRALATIIHTLHMEGIRTTENEITRIAVNFVIDEFNRQKKHSLLKLVLDALQQ